MSDGVTFYFMRHGETFLNALERMQGWCNAPLTENGIADVKRSGRGLADVKFDAVYTSDLYRTIETAQLVLAENHHAHGLEIKPMQEFREVHFGYYEGLPVADVWPQIIASANSSLNLPDNAPEQIEATLNTFKKQDPTGLAENYLEFWMRVESGLLKLLYKHAGTNQNILVVCHGLTIRNLIHGLVYDVQDQTHLANASITTVKYINGQFQLINYNETSHFKEMVKEVEQA